MHLTTRSTRVFWAAAALSAMALAVPLTAWAATTYKIQPIIAIGDTLAGVRIAGAAPGAGPLSDQGDCVIVCDPFGAGEALFYYANSTFTPICVPGQDAPSGKWPRDCDTRPPAMNGRGTVAFTATVTIGGVTGWGVFRWDRQTLQVSPVALPATPAVNGLTFVRGQIPGQPAINNRDEVVFSLFVSDAAGRPQRAAFFLGTDGKLVPIALPNQPFPGGTSMRLLGSQMSVNDAGMVAFTAVRQGDLSDSASAYLWEKGTITPVALIGDAAPGGGTITRVSAVFVNNQDRSVLVAARVAAQLSSPAGRVGLYRFAEGRLFPVALPDEVMPDGGKLLTIQEYGSSSGFTETSLNISTANGTGQHAFIATLEGGGQALYQLEPGTREAGGGKLSLILKSGTMTELGEITRFLTGLGMSFNGRGQVGVPVKITGRPDMTVLLTPTAP